MRLEIEGQVQNQEIPVVISVRKTDDGIIFTASKGGMFHSFMKLASDGQLVLAPSDTFLKHMGFQVDGKYIKTRKNEVLF